MLEIISWVTKPNGSWAIDWIIYDNIDWGNFELDPRYPVNPLFKEPKFVVKRK